MKTKEKTMAVILALLVTCLSCLAGCGAAGNAGQETEISAAAESGTAGEETGATTETAENEPEAVTQETENESGEQEPESADFVYLEEYRLKDALGGGKECTFFAPKGGSITDEWFFSFDDYGVDFLAVVYDGGSAEKLLEYLEDSVESTAEVWREDPECSDVNVGEVLEKGDDRYIFLTATDTDTYGIAYQRKELYYMSAREEGVGVFFEIEVCEDEQSEETAILVDEMARCYGLDLSEFAMENGAWAEQREQLKVQEEQERAQVHVDSQDVYEPREGDPVLEKVEGYQYLGKMTFIFEEEAGITYPVFVPMGWLTSTREDSASASAHGVSVQARATLTHTGLDLQEETQQGLEEDLEKCNDPEKGNRNVRISEVMPMRGQEKGIFYVLEYEEPNFGAEGYHERVDITCMIPVEGEYFLNYNINLSSDGYDMATNTLIKELETAYGLDLSKWYAEE